MLKIEDCEWRQKREMKGTNFRYRHNRTEQRADYRR